MFQIICTRISDLSNNSLTKGNDLIFILTAQLHSITLGLHCSQRLTDVRGQMVHMVSLGFAETNQEPISTQTLAAKSHLSLNDITVSCTKRY